MRTWVYRSVLAASLGMAGHFALAQLQNWEPKPYYTDSTLVFHDDLDFYLNSYSKQEIKQMRHQVNVWRMNWDKVIRATIDDIRAYSEGNNMDPHTHDFGLPEARNGGNYKLSEHKGRIRAFMFGSISNPPARMQLPYWDRLVTKYAGRPVDLFVIYGKELHPGDHKSFRKYPAPKSQEEKLAYAQEFAQLTKMPVLVDGLDDAVLNAYGRVPNGAYVVDEDGNLIFRGTWADSRKIEHIIDTLLQWYADGRPAAPKGRK
ncbi:MAG: hypothetical protein QM724_06760 [Flavobacteriales bacterium]